LADGSTLTKSEVIALVDDCVANSGHDLVSDFRNLWPYAYANKSYKFAADNNLNWVGDDKGNVETVFSINFTPYGGWNAPLNLSYSNQLVLYMSVRTNGKVLQDFGQGWGGGIVNSQLYDSFEAGDLRKAGSIINVRDPQEGNIYEKYQTPVGEPNSYWNADNTMHETGMWQKKYASVLVEGTGMYDYILGVGTQSNYQLWNMQDEVILRFADILLMGAELGSSKAQEYFDRVRTRAWLSSKPVSLDAIKAERRHELAFEGVRHFDLLRWHDEVAAYAAVKDVPVLNAGIEDTYTSTYRSETNGFLPIPEQEIALSNGKLVQNPGW